MSCMAPYGSRRNRTCDFDAQVNMKLRLKNRWRTTLALVGFALASSVFAAQSGEVLVRFSNGETITKDDFSAYVDKRMDLRPVARNLWGVEKVLREMALARALVLEGEKMGEPRRTGSADNRFDDVYSLAIFRKITKACEPPADAAAARKFFDENPQVFRVPPMARLSRIILPDDQKVDEMPSMGWLYMAAKAINAGSKTFDEAAQYAQPHYKLEPQGDLGWVTLVDSNVIMRALASAQTGEMVGPIREGDFAYLFQVVAKRDARQLTWDEVAVSVPTRALQYCREQTNKKVHDDMYEKYGVEFDQTAIKRMFKLPSEKEAENVADKPSVKQ